MIALLPSHTCTPRRSLQGQALTEFLALAVAIVPLYLLIPVIAKYQDMAAQVEMAGRYVTFEAMTRNDAQSSWKTPAELTGEVRRRFLGNADAPIKTGDVAGNFLANQNLFWRGPDGAALIRDFDADVSVSFGPKQGPTHADAFSPANDGAPFNALTNTADKLGLSARGIYTGNVSIRLANLPAGLKVYEPFDTINLAIARHTSIAINGWQANDPAQVQSRIDNGVLVPATKLRNIAPVVNASVAVLEMGHVHGPKLGQLDFWSDVVPSDRTR